MASDRQLRAALELMIGEYGDHEAHFSRERVMDDLRAALAAVPPGLAIEAERLAAALDVVGRARGWTRFDWAGDADDIAAEYSRSLGETANEPTNKFRDAADRMGRAIG